MYRPLDSRGAKREAPPLVVGSRVKFTTDWWWSGGDSNPRPLECDSSALPAELPPHFEVVPTTRIELLDCIQLYLEAQTVKGIRPNTLETTAYYLRPFLQSLARQGVYALDAVKPHHLRRWLLERREAGLSPQTVRDSYALARGFWRWCVQQELTTNDPFAKVEPPKVERTLRRVLNPEQVERLLQATEGKGWLQRRDRALLLTLLDSGMRIHECHQLTVGDASQEALLIRGKGGKRRVVVLSGEVRLALRKYLLALPYRLNDDSPLWWGRYGILTLDGLKRAVVKIGVRAGVKVSPHDLRRTYATWSLRNGMSLEHLRRLMGHSDYRTLQQYVSILESDLKRAHAEHSPLTILRRKPRE